MDGCGLRGAGCGVQATRGSIWLGLLAMLILWQAQIPIIRKLLHFICVSFNYINNDDGDGDGDDDGGKKNQLPLDLAHTHKCKQGLNTHTHTDAQHGSHDKLIEIH